MSFCLKGFYRISTYHMPATSKSNSGEVPSGLVMRLHINTAFGKNHYHQHALERVVPNCEKNTNSNSEKKFPPYHEKTLTLPKKGA